jgi:hypothetical protein
MSRQLQKLFLNKIIASLRVFVVIYLMSVVGQVSSKEPCKKTTWWRYFYTLGRNGREQSLEELEWAFQCFHRLLTRSSKFNATSTSGSEEDLTVKFIERDDELSLLEKQETGWSVEKLSYAKGWSCTRKLADWLEYILYFNWGLNEIGGC